MAQEIKQGSIFGRIGSGIGKGLAEQLPEEINRGRLAAGLKNLSEKKGQTPFQQFSALSSIPGVTPQMIQSGSDLLRQQARGDALAKFGQDQNQQKPNPFPQRQTPGNGQAETNTPSITQEQPLAEIQQGAIPPTKDEEFVRAGQLYNEKPERFGNDPQKALDFVASETDRNQAINQAYQQKHANLSGIQDNVVARLNSQYNKLKGEGEATVPAELYSKIEDEAIQATKSKKEGGEGLTEQQAMKKYGDKLNDAERDFSKIDEIGNWGITLRPANETLRAMKGLQNKMEMLGETDNFAKKLIASNKLSPTLAYAIAEPVTRVPELGYAMKSLPSIEIRGSRPPAQISVPKTLEIAPRLAQIVKNNEKASPLAIAHELEKKGYDPQTWLKYITDHQKELNLRQRQSEQAETPMNIISPWNDWWLSSFSGLD